MVGSIEAIENGAYRIRHLKVDAEVGDSKVAGFKPKLKLNRWGGECFLDLDFKPDGLEEEEIEEETDAQGNITKVKWKIKTADDEMEFEFYPVEPREEIVVVNGKEHRLLQCDEGGLEWKPVFKKKPKKLIWSFPFQTEGLRFAVQPSLHPDHPMWNERMIRPENVVGSYAFYHATKKNNEYMTGKAFHLYYPYLIDADGWKVRAEGFNLSDGKMMITLPQQFMDEASYPVTVDPDFGFTNIGATPVLLAHFALGSLRSGNAWNMPAGGGTVNYIRMYVAGDGNPTDCKVFINQKDSGGAGTHGQIAGPVENLACATNLHWEEFTFADEELTGGIDYILNAIGDKTDPGGDDFYWTYADGDGDNVATYNEEQTYCGEESPWVVDPSGAPADISIFCNYDVVAVEGGGGAGAVVMGTKSLILDLLLEGII